MVTPTVRLSRRLGVGGMGSVWLADHQALKTSVVVKFIATERPLKVKPNPGLKTARGGKGAQPQ